MRLQSYEIYFDSPNFNIHFLPKNLFMEYTADKTASDWRTYQARTPCQGIRAKEYDRLIVAV